MSGTHHSAARSSAARVRFIASAAGTGKTTALAGAYLELLADGIDAGSAIAITFTRKAAAELGERVSLALLASLPGERGDRARKALTALAGPLSARLPVDLARRALEALPEAPIGTTDSFVARLLSEFALYAALPVPGGGSVPLDVPLRTGKSSRRAVERAALRLLDPPDGGLDPDLALLVRYIPLDLLLADLSRANDLDELPLLTAEDLFGSAARVAAAALCGLDLFEILDLSRQSDEETISAALVRLSPSARWAAPEIAGWLARGAEPLYAPSALCVWLQGLSKEGPGAEIVARTEAAVRPFGPVPLSAYQIASALSPPYDTPEHLSLAERLRAARARLRARVISEGLRSAALSGNLGYDDLLDAAIALCERPPPRLIGRYRALLVDEVQDTSPRQLRLYRTLADSLSLRCYFVGDTRQSIYLFRGADPEAVRSLSDASGIEGTKQALAINRRSAPRLVAAHRALFSALAPHMERQKLRPIEPLDGVEADPASAALALDPELHRPDEPVWIVESDRTTDRDLDEVTLSTFLSRVERARSEPGRASDTAVVLAPSWGIAEQAARQLCGWMGSHRAAILSRGTGRYSGRVADDLRLLLRALLDRGDEAAWLGLWKHPSIGLSDAALARIVAWAGASSEPPARHLRLGGVVEEDALHPPHDERDRAAFLRAKGPLIEALSASGRGPTAQILDALTDTLEWRAVLAASPGGESDIAELDVLLDQVREYDAEGLSAQEILDRFDDDAAERPQLHLPHPPEQIVCTTIYQAKGLAWDHVAVLRPGQHTRRGADRDACWLLVEGKRARIEGLTFDPRGEMRPIKDPMGRLAETIQATRYAEEAARLLYVAITRARRSVTLALPLKARSRWSRPDGGLRDLLSLAWGSGDLAGVARTPPPPPRTAQRPLGLAIPTGLLLPERRAAGRQWREVTPSSEPPNEAEISSILERVRLCQGLHLGSGEHLSPPEGLHKRNGTPVRSDEWGSVAHSWFAAWRFRGPPERLAVEGHLRAEWGGCPEEVARWLFEISERLRAVGGPLWDVVSDPENKLFFELPLLSAIEDDGSGRLVSGRIDLLVQNTSGSLAVIDFKSGGLLPSGWDDLEEALRPAASQAQRYAEALRGASRRVDLAALWFVRDGSSVRWRP